MSHVLIVLGSSREASVAKKVLKYVQKEIATRDTLTASVADLREVNLPFYDNPHAPATPEHVTTDENVIAWGKLVEAADSVLLITPEYNHGLSAIQKNAMDSLAGEWKDKPVAVVAYGWSGGSRSIAQLTDLVPHLGAKLLPSITSLAFKKDINPDGTIADEASVTSQITATIDQL